MLVKNKDKINNQYKKISQKKRQIIKKASLR